MHRSHVCVAPKDTSAIAAFSPRAYHSSVAVDGYVVVIAGFGPSGYLNDVWVSPDGGWSCPVSLDHFHCCMQLIGSRSLQLPRLPRVSRLRWWRSRVDCTCLEVSATMALSATCGRVLMQVYAMLYPVVTSRFAVNWFQLSDFDTRYGFATVVLSNFIVLFGGSDEDNNLPQDRWFTYDGTNCTTASHCSLMNRFPCADVANTCGVCFPLTDGIAGNANSQCSGTAGSVPMI